MRQRDLHPQPTPSRCNAGLRTGGAAVSECRIASSRPIDPAMESRNDSVQVASASSRST